MQVTQVTPNCTVQVPSPVIWPVSSLLIHTRHGGVTWLVLPLYLVTLFWSTGNCALFFFFFFFCSVLFFIATLLLSVGSLNWIGVLKTSKNWSSRTFYLSVDPWTQPCFNHLEIPIFFFFFLSHCVRNAIPEIQSGHYYFLVHSQQSTAQRFAIQLTLEVASRDFGLASGSTDIERIARYTIHDNALWL